MIMKAEHYSENPDRQATKLRLRAGLWKYSAEMERLAELSVSNPDGAGRLSPTLRMSLGYYLNDKKIAAQSGRDVSAAGNEGVTA
ncbi:hypothetical protein OG948_24545 [Embleya sp. NBC_00888]|uniref:hypothetical protein n=1 Tax=Embleya sp. NBC_00888 TaxID=2975960 RepID=UPI0038632833|nr:hypothetical protein OG948_24545 [Embleya sp. NBC_00888]